MLPEYAEIFCPGIPPEYAILTQHRKYVLKMAKNMILHISPKLANI